MLDMILHYLLRHMRRHFVTRRYMASECISIRINITRCAPRHTLLRHAANIVYAYAATLDVLPTAMLDAMLFCRHTLRSAARQAPLPR